MSSSWRFGHTTRTGPGCTGTSAPSRERIIETAIDFP